MSFSFQDSTARTAWGNGNSQTGQLTAFRALWSGDVSVRYYTSGGTHLGTATHSGWDAIDTSTTPYSVTLAGRPAAWAHLADGTAAYCIVAVPGGADIIRSDVSLAAAVSASTGVVNLDNAAGAAGLRINASSALPFSDLPAWMASAPLDQWVAIPNSTLDGYTTPDGVVVSYYILDAYSGFHVREDTGELVFRGGGHSDYSGNEVIGLQLAPDSPALRTICEPTPVGDRVAAAVWWGTPPNAKPNTAHTFDSGIYSAELGRHVWFGQSSPWNVSGGVTGGDRMFSLVANTGAWVQLADDLGALPSGAGRACAKDAAGNLYLAGGLSNTRIFKYTVGSGWSELAADGALNGNSYYALVCDTSRNKLLRLGDGLISGLWFTIDCSSGEVTDVAPLLNGAGSIVADLNALTVKDSPAAIYDPHGDRYLIPTGNGPTLYAINAGTWTVTLLTPTTESGTVPNGSGYPTVGLWGRFKYVPTLRAAVYFPTGLSNGWALRLV